MQWTLILVIVLVLAIICWPSMKENFIDFGFSGYRKPIDELSINKTVKEVDVSDYTKVLSNPSSEEVKDILNITQSYVNKNFGVCLHPILVNYVDKYTGPEDPKTKKSDLMYKSRAMFFDSRQHFGVQVDSTVVNNELVFVGTQTPISTYGIQMDDMEGKPFVEYKTIMEDNKPSKSALDALITSLSQTNP